MKRLFLTILFVVLFASLFAQDKCSIEFTLVDSSSAKPLAGAVVELTGTPLSKPQYYTSNVDGTVRMKLDAGKYRLFISFLGYHEKTLPLSTAGTVMNLGKIYLRENPTQIAAVVKEVQQFRTTQNADTLVYNADAFKVAADADVEKMLQKMPGIIVEDGKVEVQGENVKKVFVDGREFFGDDVNMALKTLPAEVIDRVEVFDKLSDEAEFSGVDDGEGFKAINLVTRKSMRIGKFGKMFAGLGYQPNADASSFNPKYLVGGNANFFQKRSRFTVLGLFNNINEQNFSLEDLLGVTSGNGGKNNSSSGNNFMVKPQDGVARVSSLGVNYSDEWGRKHNVKIQASYFFNNTSTTNLSRNDTWFCAPTPFGTRHFESKGTTGNDNHRLNSRLEWKIARNQSLLSRTNFSYQKNTPLSAGHGFTNADSELVDFLADVPRRGLAYSETGRDNMHYGMHFNQFLQYRLRFGRPGRTLTVEGRFNYRTNNATKHTLSNENSAIPFDDDPQSEYQVLYDQYFSLDGTWTDMRENPLLFQPLYQLIKNPSDIYNIRAGMTYIEPIAPKTRLTLQYRYSIQHNERDQDAWYTDESFDPFSSMSKPNPNMSLNSFNEHQTHRLGPGIRYSKNKNTIVLNAFYLHHSLMGDIQRSDAESRVRKTYDDILYFAMLRWAFNSQNTIRMYFRSNVDAPSISQMHTIFDVSSPQYLNVGNLNLRPSYSHSFTCHYVNSNTEKGRTFMVTMGAEYEQNRIAASTLYNPKGIRLPDSMNGIPIPKDKDGRAYSPTQITSFENLDGFWSARLGVSYGLPLSFMKSNLNLAASVKFVSSPCAIYAAGDNRQNVLDNMASHNYEVNNARHIAYNFHVTLGSNISENIDFTVSWRGSVHQAWNTLALKGTSLQEKNLYFNHRTKADMKFVFLRGFTFTASAIYKQYVGFTNDYKEDFLLCNLYLGHKFLKSRRAEVLIGVNDVFNQNKAFARTVGSGYTRNSIDSVIGRYYMVQFVYNLRSFKGQGSAFQKSKSKSNGMKSSKRMGDLQF